MTVLQLTLGRFVLSDRRYEIVILTAASEIRSTYEWHQHVNIAMNVGITKAEIRASARDGQIPFSMPEEILMAYTGAVARGRVEEPLYKAISEHFDDRTIVGIVVTAGSYAALGNFIDALGIEIETGDKFVGWDPSTGVLSGHSWLELNLTRFDGTIDNTNRLVSRSIRGILIPATRVTRLW